MATTVRNTVEVLTGDYGPKKEALAAAGITPGMLLERDSNNKFKAHATAGGHAQSLFAVEDDLQSNEITTAYSTGNRVFARVFRPGDEVYALIANGENIAIGDKLVSNGDGYLKKRTEDSSGTIVEEYVVTYALEAVDLSDSSGADPATQRCLVEVC
jgi:hypothetical protein